MNVHVDLCIVPMGVGVSVSRYIVACQDVLDDYDLSHTLHAYGTNIEGDYDTVFKAIKACHVKIHSMGAPRITTSIKLGTRVDRNQTLQDKVESVETKRGNQS